MKLHVLPGDAYLEAFRGTGLEGQIAVFRECLVEGDLRGETLTELWEIRNEYLSTNYPDLKKSYRRDVAGEIEKLLVPDAGDEIFLWFEYELFCSVNYWFCVNMLRDSHAAVYRVAPTVREGDDVWKGFGRLSSDDLLRCWETRVKLSKEELEHGAELWQAFKAGKGDRLRALGEIESPAFPLLKEVAIAGAELDTRPRRLLADISSNGGRDFGEVLAEFADRAGVYGFGDAQVRKLLNDIEGQA
jgi:hypothetical protein